MKICPLVKGVGWATVLINFMMAMFYNTIISWAVYYLVMSFAGIGSELPWKGCHHHWNTECCVAADANEYETKLQVTEFGQRILNATTSVPTHCNRSVYSTEEFF